MEIKKHTDVPKRTRNAIEARLKKACQKYGFDAVRLTAAQVFNKVHYQRRLQKEIEQKGKELDALIRNSKVGK